MTGPPIELLVLDGQGVVFTDPLAGFFDQLADETGQDRRVVTARWREQVRDPAWRGAITDDAMWQALAGDDGRGWGPRLEAAYGPGPAAPWLPRWADRVPVWLLTNHRTAWIVPRLERFGLRSWFDRVLVSDALAALKPEPAVFAPLLAYARDPGTVLFVDDQASNVAAAASHGLSTILAAPDGAWLAEVERRLAGPGRAG